MSNEVTPERSLRDYNMLLTEARRVFDITKEIKSPYFKESILLTSDGLNHLLNKPNRQPRNFNEKKLKLRLLKIAIQIIEKANTLQEYRNCFEKQGKQSIDGFTKMKTVKYWAFHHLLLGKERTLAVRAIVRQVGDGPKHFWSVMPIGTIGKQKIYINGIESV